MRRKTSVLLFVDNSMQISHYEFGKMFITRITLSHSFKKMSRWWVTVFQRRISLRFGLWTLALRARAELFGNMQFVLVLENITSLQKTSTPYFILGLKRHQPGHCNYCSLYHMALLKRTWNTLAPLVVRKKPTHTIIINRLMSVAPQIDSWDPLYCRLSNSPNCDFLMTPN